MRYIVFIFSYFTFLFGTTVSAQDKLIPHPTHIKQDLGFLDLTAGIRIEESSALLTKEHQLAQTIFEEWAIAIRDEVEESVPAVKLVLVQDTTTDRSDESYHLQVHKEGVKITAPSPEGIFYGLQTLRQFTLQDHRLAVCEIQDKPAFSWRGFLVDVGRNYQPLSMLKEQVDVMARYKLNVLHFHFTEDIAWRLASKKYPGLTNAKYMTRWAGDFYTEAEFRELMAYCADRHILLLPEIDMPGHSGAFKRYFGVDMQSDSGIMYIKELLEEFATTYPGLPYLHIGGDEVKITNKNFMPEITRFVEELGYNTVGWDPGSNLMPQTIRQLWMGGPEAVTAQGEMVYIDSKHLYINHMDPLETVTTLFFRRIGEQDAEHRNLKGAVLCSWPDRAVAAPEDMFYQNAIYPSLLTFAERIWQGGGKSGWVANIPPVDTEGYTAFREFEGRLLVHQQCFLSDKPFPYTKQTDTQWELIGPFDNDGKLSQSFAIENNLLADTVEPAKTVMGGTVILRHWWADIIPGVIDNPKPNTTWYARTKIWSDEAGSKPFWIGFDNLSRSYASDSPAAGTWDNRQSKLWVNGTLIEPPVWRQAGQKGELETPLIDEGYSFREPTMIALKKGWNNVLIKLPVASFKGADWQNPVKWMFTFIPYTVDED
ncbi:MAG TPA: family 20 glycosylhydrolase [Sphingobacterium sp.]|nr:family 20 glycosylhydrolase [Sphingobacterium sp.]